MIKELSLTNWKSFANATLHIDPLTVLIGSNAGGKSNTLDALLFLNRVSQGNAIFTAIAGDVKLPALRGGIEWICRKPEKQFSISVTLSSDNAQQDYRYDLTVQVNGTKAEVHAEELTLLTYGSQKAKPKPKILFKTRQDESSTPAIPTYFYSGTQGHGNKMELSRSGIILAQAETLNVRKEVQDGVKQVISQLRKIFVFDPIPSHMRGYAQLSERLLSDGSNIAGVLAGLEKTRKAQVEKSLTHYLKDLPERDIKRIWAETVGKFGADAMLYCKENWGDHTHEMDARGMSDGTLRYLAIVTALLTRESGSLLVIEEVDNGLHPSRARLLINMLKALGEQQNIDVLVTTHNPALLDAAGIVMIPFIVVAHRDNATGFSRLTQLEDIEQLPKFIAGGSLGDLSRDGLIEAAFKQVCEK
jgi:predicted ATPase